MGPGPGAVGQWSVTLSGLLDAVRPDPGVTAVVDAARAGTVAQLDVVAPTGVRPLLAAAVAAPAPLGADRPLLLVTATGRESEDLAAALRCYLPEHAVAEFPAWETLPHERLSPRSDTVGRRLAVLRRLAHPDADGEGGPVRVLVAPVRAVMQPVVGGLGDLVPVRLRTGDDAGLEETVEALAAAAYTRTDMVERRGEFAVRGGILDVFPPTEDHPVRVEFWGDTVEEVRWFSVADQRSLEVAEHGLWAPPCREVLLTDAVRARAASLTDRLPGVADMLLKISEGIAVEGMESLAPALVDEMQPLLDLLPDGTTSSSSTPRRSAPAPTTWWRRARSSSPPRGRTPPPATTCPSTSRPSRPMSTSVPRRTGRSPGSASTPCRRTGRGGRSPP